MSPGVPRSYRRTYQAARDLVAIPGGSTYHDRRPLVLEALRGRTPDELRYLLHNPDRVGIEGYHRSAPTGHVWLLETIGRDNEAVLAILDHSGVVPLRLAAERRSARGRLRTVVTALAVVAMWCASTAIAVALVAGIGLRTWDLVVGLGAVVGSYRPPPSTTINLLDADLDHDSVPLGEAVGSAEVAFDRLSELGTGIRSTLVSKKETS